jgi:hypothetical protein
MAWALWARGRVAVRQGDLSLAAAALAECLALWRHFGKQMGIGVAHQALAELAWAEGKITAFGERLRASLAIWQGGTAGETYNRGRVAECLELLAAVIAGVALGHRPAPLEPQASALRESARLLGTVEALRVTFNIPRPPVYQPTVDATLAAARAGLGAAQFDRAWASGQALTTEEAITEAIGLLPAPGG